jgi:hypothetical protein
MLARDVIGIHYALLAAPSPRRTVVLGGLAAEAARRIVYQTPGTNRFVRAE